MTDRHNRIKDTIYGRFYITDESLSLHMAKEDQNYMWEDHLKDSFDKYGTGRTVIEVGASAGWHTVYLARIAANVISFEPQRPQYETLLANLKLNGRTNVQVYNQAVYSTPRRMSTNTPVPYHQVGHEACAMHLKDDLEGDIEAVVLDSLKVDNVGLIKIDAQGCDLHVLMGATRLIERDRPALLYEFDSVLAGAHGHTLRSYDQFIESIGYKKEALNERDWLAIPR